LASRPGSVFDVWLLGVDVGTTHRVVGPLVVPAMSANIRRRRAQQEKWVFASIDEVGKFHPQTGGPQSPVAEGIARISLDTIRAGMRRSIVLITDMREESDGLGVHFECGRADPKTFVQLLRERCVFSPNALRGIRIVVAFADTALDPIPKSRCSVSLERAARIRTAWRDALQSAGATVTIVNGAPTTNDIFGEEQ
jgi:hypothetical protein